MPQLQLPLESSVPAWGALSAAAASLLMQGYLAEGRWEHRVCQDVLCMFLQLLHGGWEGPQSHLQVVGCLHAVLMLFLQPQPLTSMAVLAEQLS